MIVRYLPEDICWTLDSILPKTLPSFVKCYESQLINIHNLATNPLPVYFIIPVNHNWVNIQFQQQFSNHSNNDLANKIVQCANNKS